jgi:hypothetical protein
MRSVRSPRWALVAVAVGLVAGAFGAGAVPGTAPAASPHHAAVIVDTGSTVKRAVVTFDEDSITGLDALQRAGTNPVVYQFGGQGGAVCRLLGVGRDAGPNCLGGADGDARYWAYFRAPAGTSSFKYSSIGAGSARVHDGDVEGWKFGTGTAPQYVSLASLLPPPTQPPATQPPATAPPATTGRGTNGAVTGDPGTSGTPGATAAPGDAPSAPTASTLPATGGKDTSTSGRSTDRASAKSDSSKGSSAGTDDGKSVDAALASSDSDGGGGGGSAWSLVLFAVLLVAIAVAIVLVRRVRKHASTG